MNCKIALKLLLVSGWLWGFLSCTHPSASDADAACGEDSIAGAGLASYFRLTDTLGLRRLDIFNPWQNGVLLERYYLVADSITPTQTDGLRLQVPLERMAVSSATHVGFLTALSQEHRIVAMTTPHLIYNSPSQPVSDIGEDIRLQVEPLLLSRPDALIVSSYGSPNPSVVQAQEMGIKVVTLVEWMEQNPLARSEWIRVFGALTGTLPQADSIWHGVCKRYAEVAAQQRHDTLHRSIVSGLSFRGTWYVPAGNTYMGQLLRDAGAEYAFAHRNSSGSIPLTVEQVLQTFGDADVWVGCSVHSMDELARLDEKHTWFKANGEKRVFSFYGRSTEQGANDFWESGAVYPDLILQDLRWALYPEQYPTYQPQYIMHVEP